jgi:O-antigen/teichoic acid export membrane protein
VGDAVEALRVEGSERSRIVRDATWYTSATYIAQFLAFGIGIVAKRLLGPSDLGVWAVLLSLLSSLALLEFGVTQAMNRQIAYAISKGDELLVDRYKRTQFTFVTAFALLGSIGLVLYVELYRDRLTTAFAAGLLWLAVIFPLYQLHMGQVTVYWANRRFDATGLVTLIESIGMGTIGLFLIWRIGVYGQIIGFLLALLAKLAFLAWRAKDAPRLKIRFGWHAPAIRELLRVGLPLEAITLVNLAKLSGTSLLVAYFLDTTSVGYYALALSIQNYIYWTPNAFSIVMFPRFQERMATSDDDPTALRSFLVKPTIGLGYFVLPILISGSYFLVPVLIRHALPAYVPSIVVLKVLLAGTFFLSMEHMPGQLLTTSNHLWHRVALATVTILALAASVAVAVVIGASLLSIVAAVAVGNAVGFFVNFLFAYAVVGGPRVDRWFSVRLAAAFGYLMLVLMLIDRFLPAWTAGLLLDAASSTVKWLVSLVLLLPLFLIAERELSLVSTMRAFVVARIGGVARAA